MRSIDLSIVRCFFDYLFQLSAASREDHSHVGLIEVQHLANFATVVTFDFAQMDHLALTVGQLGNGLAHSLAHIAPRVFGSRFGQSLGQLFALTTHTIEAGVTYRRHCH